MAIRQSWTVFGLMLLVCAAALFMGWHYLSGEDGSAQPPEGPVWSVTDQGVLNYRLTLSSYNISPGKADGNSTLFSISFESRGAIIDALLRIPGHERPENGTGAASSEEPEGRVPGIVLLPGATVSKEREQRLASHLAELGYASITLDQRNLGGIDPKADLQIFLSGKEPVEHMMVHDALTAASILRGLSEIDPERIIYAGESNGGRFAIIAAALDRECRGVIAISTCGYGTDMMIAAAGAGGAVDEERVRFFRSIDPDSYLKLLPPRPLVMIHSENDTVIPYALGRQSFRQGIEPKRMHSVGCARHGYCPEMDRALLEELSNMTQKRDRARY